MREQSMMFALLTGGLGVLFSLFFSERTKLFCFKSLVLLTPFEYLLNYLLISVY